MVVLALLNFLFFGLWISARSGGREVSSLQDKLSETLTNFAAAQSENQTNQEKIAALRAQVAGLEQEKANVTQAAKGLENELRADLESKDVTISNLKGKLTVNILDSIMFDSGEAVLKPEGQAVMQKIADLLAKHPELNIHVIGHADNVPIRAGARGRFASNWELSTARALSAVHFLTESAGVDARRLGAVGYGEFRPVADNATAEGRAKNRRIAIAILPVELSATNALPEARSELPANSIPTPDMTDAPK
jgi:chemotaxis protein MotB